MRRLPSPSPKKTMMLTSLTQIAEHFGLTFIYGEKEAFNIIADGFDPNLTVMYHEGYVAGTTTEDAQGAWETSYNLRIWLLIKNKGLNDSPSDRQPRFESLEPLMYQILTKLGKNYSIGGAVTFSEGINQTDKNLDGIRFVANCVAKELQAYC